MKNIQLLGCGLLRKVLVLLAIFFAIVFNLSAQGPAPSPARDAQGNILPAAAAGTATAERVIVTGSNIPTAEEVGPNPVETFTHEDLQKSGLRSTEQFLLSLPIVTSNVIAVSNNENGSNTAVGAAAVSLRGLDPRATLILMDGRRIAPYPVGNNPGPVNTMFVDLNSIPQAAIENIEILKDGASTQYGADAVAGVVNLKMRHHFDGAEAIVDYGHNEHKVFEDQLVAYGDFMYQNVKTHNELAPPATGSFQTAGQVTIAIPPDTPIAPGSEPPGTPTHAATGVPADAFNPFNPFHQIIS